MTLKAASAGVKIRAVITGSTGMVGEGVLHECLEHPEVEQGLVINRKPCGQHVGQSEREDRECPAEAAV